MRRVWRKKIAEPVLNLLALGMTSEQMALSVALGVVLGVCPVFGFPTMFCIPAALVLRLNLPALQIVNYLVYPLQLILLIPFVRLGGWLFQPAPISSPIFGVLTATLHAVVAWLCVGAPAGLLLYVLLRGTIKIGRYRKASCTTNPATVV